MPNSIAVAFPPIYHVPNSHLYEWTCKSTMQSIVNLSAKFAYQQYHVF